MMQMHFDIFQLEKRAEAGDASAQLACARFYGDIAMRKQKFIAQYAWNDGLHDRRDVDMSAYEREIARDLEVSFGWYVKAAGKGGADALYELGMCYLEGEGTAPCTEKAQELFLKAAESGHADARLRLAMQYYEGFTGKDGFEIAQDYEKAVRWLKKEAEGEDVFALYYLAQCYEHGTGVEEDPAEAVRLYRRVTEAEHPQAEAFYELARCYELGRGVPADSAKAVELYTKAAEEGDMRAALKLGECYERGVGVEKSRTRAIEWYNVAAEQGDGEAISALYRLSS